MRIRILSLAGGLATIPAAAAAGGGALSLTLQQVQLVQGTGLQAAAAAVTAEEGGAIALSALKFRARVESRDVTGTAAAATSGDDRNHWILRDLDVDVDGARVRFPRATYDAERRTLRGDDGVEVRSDRAAVRAAAGSIDLRDAAVRLDGGVHGEIRR